MARKTDSKSSKSGSKSRSSDMEHSAQMTTDHDEIRRWAEERGGKPACVRGTENDDSCLLRIDFPGGAGEESLAEMDWDDFFRVLDKRDLVFLYQNQKADGEQSTFNKLISAEEASAQQNDRSSGGRGRSGSTRGGRGSSQDDKKKSSGRHGRGSR
jgi:hypothetical protein